MRFAGLVVFFALKNEVMVTLALIQMQCAASMVVNLKKAIEKIREAQKKGAQIISLSELFLSPYFCQVNDDRFFSLAEAIPGPTTEALSQLAKELKVVLVASLFEKDKNNYYNTAIVIDADGKLLGKYRKVHIPDDLQNHYSEMYYFKPGDLGIKPFETRYGKIGVLVCWDQWYPEAARTLALQGAKIIFYPTAIGWQVNQKSDAIANKEFEAWVTIQRSHAIANGVIVASANRTGLENHIEFWGGSFVCEPYGNILTQASHAKEEVLIAQCDLNQIDIYRKDWPFLTCRRTDAYSS